MSLVITYPSIPNLLCAWFPTVAGELSVTVDPLSISTDLPPAYKDVLPFVRVARLSGPRQLGIDRALVRFETFASTYDDAETLANELDSLVEFDLNSFSDGKGRVMLTQSIAAPQWAPWDDQQVARFMGSYRLTVGAQQ